MDFKDDLPFYLNKHKLTSQGIEIGAGQGFFSKYLLSYWHGKKLYLIDNWIQPADSKEPQKDMAYAMNYMGMTVENTYKFGFRPIIMRGIHTELSQLFKKESLDFVYINETLTHKTPTTMHDIDSWVLKIKKGGIICGTVSRLEIEKCVSDSDFKVKFGTKDQNFWWVEL